jgi:hypothetical protein
MYLVVPIVESQPILHVKAPLKHALDQQVSSDHGVYHLISTRVLDCHTRPHLVSQFSPLSPNLVTVTNCKPKAGVTV